MARWLYRNNPNASQANRERLDDREFERSQQRLTAEEGDLRRQHTEVQ